MGKHKLQIHSQGQSLVEAIVALSAGVIIVSAIVVAVISSLNNSDYAKNQNLATSYAQEELEVLKSQARTDWKTVSSYPVNNSYCAGSDGSFTQNASCNTVNIGNVFIRQVDIVTPGSGCVYTPVQEVQVKVSWSDGKCDNGSFCHSVVLDACLTDVNTLPTI